MKNIKTINANSNGMRIHYERTNQTAIVKYTELYQNTRQTSQKFSNRLNLNPIQRTMYRRVMYGLTEFTPEEIKSMEKQTVKLIELDNKRAKHVIEKLKYDMYYGPVDKLFNAIFPHVQIGSKPYDYFVPLPSLKELKISTYKVCETLIEAGLLPKNFFNLDTQTLDLS